MALIVFSLLASPAIRAGDSGRCGVCHGDVRVKFEAGIHHREDISCVNCHGGNPKTDDLRAAHGGVAKPPARQSIPALCASCHANVAMMKVYNLATDQYALYQSSQHGLELAKGNLDAAVCTDCHGVHDIRPHQDPTSLVYLLNIPKTCSKCHSRPDFIAKYHRQSDPYREFSGSVHGQALLKDGNLQAPECSRCHGVHGATPPGVGDVSKVCGQCHGAARRYFEASPHRDAMAAGGEPECASCHSNHSIQPAGELLLGSVCARCHAESAKDPARRIAAAIDGELGGTRKQLQDSERLVREAEAVPINVEDYRGRLEEARSYLTESLPAVHSFSLEEVRLVTVRSKSISEEVGREVHEKLVGLRWRKYGLLIFWFYLILTVVILLRFRRKLADSTVA